MEEKRVLVVVVEREVSFKGKQGRMQWLTPMRLLLHDKWFNIVSV